MRTIRTFRVAPLALSALAVPRSLPDVSPQSKFKTRWVVDRGKGNVGVQTGKDCLLTCHGRYLGRRCEKSLIVGGQTCDLHCVKRARLMRGAAYHRHGHRHRVGEMVDAMHTCIAGMYAFKSMCPPHFNMAGGGRGVKAILNEFSLQAKCELMIRSLIRWFLRLFLAPHHKMEEQCNMILFLIPNLSRFRSNSFPLIVTTPLTVQQKCSKPFRRELHDFDLHDRSQLGC